MTLAVVAALVFLAGCSGELIPMPPPGGGGPDAASPGGGADAEPLGPTFRNDIAPDLIGAGCLVATCHGGTTPPMQLIATPATEAEWLANYNEVRLRAGTATASPLIDKAVGAGGHTAAVVPTDPMLQDWRDWISAGTPYQ